MEKPTVLINLAETILLETNFTLNNEQRSTIRTIVFTMDKAKKLPSEIANKVCVYLNISKQDNFLNLVNIITEYKRQND